MSKLYLKISYKNACILKHALRNQIESKKAYMINNINVFTKEGLKRFQKELDEEERALTVMSDEIDRKMTFHNRRV